MRARSRTPAACAARAASPAVECRVSARALPLVGEKRRLVDEELRPGRGVDDACRRRRVAGEDELAARSSRAEHLLRPHLATVREGDGLAALEDAALGAVRDAEPVRRLDVEASRAHVLDERVADGRDAVVDRERLQPVPVPLEARARLELDRLQRVGEPPEDAPERAQQVPKARRPVDRERELPSAEREGLEHARQAEVVVGVVVREEDLLELDEPDVAPEQLALGSLGAVEEEAVAAATHERRRERALRRRGGSGRPEKHDVEIHGARFYVPANIKISLCCPAIPPIFGSMASRAYRSAGLIRSLALLWTFVVASAAILASGALVLSSLLEQTFREQVLDDSAREGALFAEAVLAPTVVRGNRVVVGPRARRRLVRTVRTTEVTGIAIWSRGGKLVYSTATGRRAPGSRQQREAVLRSRSASADVTELNSVRGKARRTVRAVAVWAPLRARNGRPVGVARILAPATALDASVASATRTVWYVVGGLFAILWLALVLLVRGAAARLSRQNEALEDRSRELTESSRLVEESLLETIETLNAAVEARDPYTAGHSQRVRRVALAIGRELSLAAPQLGALATGALFHDIGKIGIPDSILTKAGPLQPAEAAIMREHVTRGAEIVSKVSSFQDAVPAIRHHHERWDGLGYPDGLRGDDIPLEAAIIGLADAWDAMTTDRPYAHGLSLNEAMLQIRSGRGKQFSPAVVDAFWAVAKRRPSDVLPPEAPTAAIVAV